MNIKAETNSGFMKIKSHQKHLLVQRHYDAEPSTLHNPKQIDATNQTNNQIQREKAKIIRLGTYRLRTSPTLGCDVSWLSHYAEIECTRGSSIFFLPLFEG